jgi:type II secretory pathway component PulK
MMAKNAQMDSLDELRLIEGWDEEVHAVFSPSLTVFPFVVINNAPASKLNINTASRALLQCLVPESKGDCQEKSALALAKRNADNSTLGAPGQKIEDILKDTLCYTPDEAKSKASWFTTNSMVFRVETRGNVGNSEKKIQAIVERTMPDPKKNEKASYKILYLKVI